MPVINTRQINGVVRTSEPVWSNLERLAEASTSWFTYDVHTGLYSWVINEAGNSEASITEADIIGPIQISGSGLNNLYNSIEIEYPNTDIRDQPHYVRLELPSSIRNDYEPDNTLQVTSEFINNQPQAEYSAMVTLKQSRLDRSVTINMDYTKINIRAGDIIDITSPTYGWEAKEFRVMRVREIEGDDGSLRLEFSCSEYDDTIYDGTWAEFLVGGAPGIISIGSIGKPGTPTVETTTLDSLPAQVVTTTVPTGIVDRMQFWAGNIAATGNINNTVFDLYGTVASSDALSFTESGNVVFTTTALRDGEWVWKSRATNVNGTGPFSDPSGNVVYVRNQAPDVIKIGTPLFDGNSIITVPGIPKSGTFAFVNLPADTVQFTGNLAYKGMVFTADAYMAGIGTEVANVTGVVAPAANCSMSVSFNTTALSDIRANVGVDAGVAVYYATAPWNESTYNDSGFGGLTWSNWNLIGLSLNDSGALGGTIRFNTTSDTAVDLSGKEGSIIAFGVSSTLLPSTWSDITPTVGADGIPRINYTKGFGANTVIFDAGANTFQRPGLSGDNVLVNGQADSWLNYRFFI